MFFHELSHPYIILNLIHTYNILIKQLNYISINTYMASSISGSCSGSSSLQNCQEKSDLRKRKRMLSNRESARRSRMRKQKLLADLTVQINNLRAENNHILTNINLFNHLHFNMESDNSVLRAQISQLNHRLQALNDIIVSGDHYDFDHIISGGSDDFFNPWSFVHVNQPIMASPDAFLYLQS